MVPITHHHHEVNPLSYSKITMKLVPRYIIAALLMAWAMVMYTVIHLSYDAKSKHDGMTRSVRRDHNHKNFTQTRIFLWAVPRSVSTTMLISMSRSPDAPLAWFEPFLFADHWERIKQSGESLTMFEQLVMSVAAMSISGGYNLKETSYERVKTLLEVTGGESIFVKEMVKAMAGKFEFIPKGYTHTFLIRHPLRVFTSYKNKHYTEGQNKGLKLTEFSEDWIPSGYFFKEIYDLVHHVRDVLKQKIIIIDSDDLLENPDQMLQKYCKEVGLTYDGETMLRWEPGSALWWDWVLPKGAALTWWYTSKLYGYNPTHKTTFLKFGFEERMELLPDDVDDDVLELADASMVYYNELYQQRLRLDSFSESSAALTSKATVGTLKKQRKQREKIFG